MFAFRPTLPNCDARSRKLVVLPRARMRSSRTIVLPMRVFRTKKSGVPSLPFFLLFFVDLTSGSFSVRRLLLLASSRPYRSIFSSPFIHSGMIVSIIWERYSALSKKSLLSVIACSSPMRMKRTLLISSSSHWRAFS